VLDLKRLTIFREVARRRSFSAAADALNYSQPAISHQISRLELEVGAQLLTRGTARGSVALTEAGSLLLARAETLLDAAASAEAELAVLTGAGRAEVRLGAFATASATIVAEAIGDLRRLGFGTRLTLIEGEAAETLEALRARTIDVGVVFDDARNPLPVDPAVSLTYRLDDPMLLALPRGHRLAAAESVSLTDLRDEDWIEGAGEETPCSLILIAACQDAGFEPRIAFNSGNFEVVQQLVAAGVGCALVPQLAVRAAHPGLAIRRLGDAEPVRRVALAVRSDAVRPPEVEAVLERLEAACARWQSRAHQASLSAPSPVH
jgi:DNA-binding transcriptional LysR family regulator